MCSAYRWPRCRLPRLSRAVCGPAARSSLVADRDLSRTGVESSFFALARGCRLPALLARRRVAALLPVSLCSRPTDRWAWIGPPVDLTARGSGQVTPVPWELCAEFRSRSRCTRYLCYLAHACRSLWPGRPAFAHGSGRTPTPVATADVIVETCHRSRIDAIASSSSSVLLDIPECAGLCRPRRAADRSCPRVSVLAAGLRRHPGLLPLRGERPGGRSIP